jgi:outer membrane protein TolC
LASKLSQRPRIPALTGAVLVVLVLSACSTGHHRRSADKEVYKIVQQAEQELFGTDSEFNIDTQFSGRKPENVPFEEIIEERQHPDALNLDIHKALDLAVENSREYQTQKELLYIDALGLTGARYEFTPQFFAGASTSVDREPGGDVSQSVHSDVGVGQMLKSGGQLGVTLANDFFRYYTGDPSRTAASVFSVNLFQPLLRGAGSDIAAENLKQAERDVIYAIRSFSQFQRQFVADVVNDYFDLLRNKDQLINAYNDYQRRLSTVQYTEIRGEAGLQSQLDVDEAKSGGLTARNSYVLAASSYLNNLDRFKLTLGLPLTTKIQLDDTPLEKLKRAGTAPLAIDRDRALRLAVENHLDLMNEIDRFEDSKRKVKVAANMLKADLNIFADASLESESPTDYTEFNLDDVRAGAGIELNLPIDRLIERNLYRRSLISFESAIRSLALELDSKKEEIDRGIRNLEAARRTYVIQTNSVAIATRRVEGEQLSLKAGRRTVRNVTDAQNQLVRSQNSLTAAIVDYRATRLQLLIDIGVLNTDVEEFWNRADAVTAPLQDEQNSMPPEAILKL